MKMSRELRVKVENKNWVLENQKSLKPLIISGLYIHNDSYQKDKYKKINICINEGQAFGTGHHGTTSGCVNALLDLQKNIKVMCLCRSFVGNLA